MGLLVQLRQPKTVAVLPFDDASPGPGEVRLQTLYSGISAGTELTQYRGVAPHLERGWDSERRLFVDGSPSLSYPLDSWGYEEVGEVDAVGDGVEQVAVGQRVWGAWRHRSSAIVTERAAAERVLPDGMEPRDGVFARIGAIALNAVLDADLHLGETVAVFGLGVPGLLAVQMAAASGAEVIAVDPVAPRRSMAARLGAAHTVDVGGSGVAESIRSLTDGRGADVSIELTGSYLALHEAIRATAYSSRVVCSGFLQGEGVGLRLGEEFHHNRISIVCSQISGVRPDLAHRWSRSRLEATVMRLIAEGRLDVEPLITHVLPVEQAAEAFRLLDEADPHVLQVILDFRSDSG